jgi:hypothetical protein
MEMHFELLAKDFLDNEKKMEDFLALSREEFLATHREFVSAQDWELTYAKLMAMIRSKVMQAKYL